MKRFKRSGKKWSERKLRKAVRRSIQKQGFLVSQGNVRRDLIAAGVPSELARQTAARCVPVLD